MYYAMIDMSVKETNPGRGFANSKAALAFYSKADRDKAVADRAQYDFSARAITRKQLFKYGLLEQVRDHQGCFGVYIGGTHYSDMVVLRASKYSDLEPGTIV